MKTSHGIAMLAILAYEVAHKVNQGDDRDGAEDPRSLAPMASQSKLQNWAQRAECPLTMVVIAAH